MATYGCVVTAVGRAKIASAMLSGIAVTLTEMAVGDGAGNDVTPTPTQTALVREVYRRSINTMMISPAAGDTLLLELVIPYTEGPFVIRECGLFDADGELIAVCNLPASVKPAPSDGANKDVVITMTVKVADASAVTVVVNPNLVIATRTWVDGNYVRHPTGAGTTGQLLRKKSNTYNDWEYYNPEFDASGFIFDAVEEPQTLITDQTTVSFVNISTAGIAVYVENTTVGLERLIAGQDFTITNATTIELATDYPDGTRLLGVQNDPNGNVTPHSIGALERSENLADLIDKPTARTNLQLAYASQAEAEAGAELLKVMSPLRVAQLINKLIPPLKRGGETGMIGLFYRTSAPTGWLPLLGGTFGPAGSGASVLSSNDCWALYELWWNEFANSIVAVTGGRGTSAADDWAAKKTMAIFNDHNEFYRAVNNGLRGVGSLEGDAMQTHRHHTVVSASASTPNNSPTVNTSAASIGSSTSGWAYAMAGATGDPTIAPTGHPTSLSGAGGSEVPPRTAGETRPMNRAVLTCVHL